MSPGPNIGGGTCPPCPIVIDAPEGMCRLFISRLQLESVICKLKW